MTGKTITILVLLANLCFAQKVSNIDFDLVKAQTEESKSVYYYPTLLKRFLEFDSTLSDADYRNIYYGNVYFSKYSPYGGGDNEGKFLDLYREKKYKEAVEAGQKELQSNPVNLKVLFKMLVCCHKLEDKTTARSYARLYYSLLDQIYKSGDGKDIETAYVVIKVADEYEILAEQELQMTKQALVGNTDVLTIETDGQKPKDGQDKIKKLYFNVSKPLDHMHKMFGK